MARSLICFLLTQNLVCKVLSSFALPAVQQYLHLAAVPQTLTIPAQSNAVPQPIQPPTNYANIANMANMANNYNPVPNQVANNYNPVTNQVATNYNPVTNQVANSYANPIATQIANNLLATYTNNQGSSNYGTNTPRPPISLPSLSPLALPNLVSGLQQTPEQVRSIDKPNVSSIDSKLLNNLAVALQLLIVSNILNSPPSGLQEKQDTELRPCSEPNVYPQLESLKNSNFLGSSTYAEPNLIQNFAPTKSSMSLMSPYEALGSNSAYSDKSFTQYSSPNPRQDFRSPYSMIDTDLFPMNDLF